MNSKFKYSLVALAMLNSMAVAWHADNTYEVYFDTALNSLAYKENGSSGRTFDGEGYNKGFFVGGSYGHSGNVVRNTTTIDIGSHTITGINGGNSVGDYVVGELNYEWYYSKNNRVNIFSGTFDRVYGGRAYTGDNILNLAARGANIAQFAESNSVLVSNATVNKELVGAYGTYVAQKNSVLVTNGSTVGGKIYGGVSASSGNIPNTYENKVIIEDSSVNKYAKIYGAVVMNNGAHVVKDNAVTLRDIVGTIEIADIAGGVVSSEGSSSRARSMESNMVTIDNTKISGSNIYGVKGEKSIGEAKNNVVVLNANEFVDSDIFGIAGDSSYSLNKFNDNQVRIKADNKFTNSTIGGSKNPANNNAVLIAGNNNTFTDSEIFGSGGGSENAVNITGNGNTFTNSQIYGAKNTTVKGTSNNNEVNIYGNTLNRSKIYGAYAIFADSGSEANFNKVTIENSNFDNGTIIGGQAYAKAGSNTIELMDSKVTNSKIFGGYSQTDSATANNIYILGNSDLTGTEIYGADGGDMSKSIYGNLYIGSRQYDTLGVNAKNIYNFSKIDFYLPKSVRYNDTVLTLSDTARTDLSQTRIYATLEEATSLSGSGAIHLISKPNGELLNNPSNTYAPTSVNIANLLNVNARIELSSDKRYLDLLFGENTTPPITWIPVDNTYNIIGPTTYSRLYKQENNPSITELRTDVAGGIIGPGYTVIDTDSGNTVNIDATLSGHVIFGGKTTNNVINFNINGEAIKGGGAIEGATSANQRAGNVLNIGTASNRTVMGTKSVSAIGRNFETINFWLPDVSTLQNGDVALTLKGRTGMAIPGLSTGADLFRSNIQVNGTADGYKAYLDGTGNKYYLIKSENDGEISLNTQLNSTQSIGTTFDILSNSDYKVFKEGIFLDTDKKSMYITKGDVTENIIGTVFGDDEVGIKNGITVNLKDADYNGLEIDLNKHGVVDADVNLENAISVGNIYARQSNINIIGSASFADNSSIEAKKLTIGSATSPFLNRLELGSLSAKELNFYLPSEIANGYTALSLTGTGTTDLTDTKVNAYLSNATGIKSVDDKIHLIKTAGLLTGFKEANGKATLTNVNIAGLINVTGNIALDNTNQYLDLSFSGDPAIKWSSKDTTFNITGPNKFTRIMTDGTNTQNQDFTISGAFDSDELVTITNATSINGTGGTFSPSLIDNMVNVNLETNTFTGKIHGGYGSTNTAEVKNNTVNINNGTINGSVYGGYITANGTNASSVTGNKVVISGGAVNVVYGGWSDGASLVADNTIDFIGGKVNSFIYGGRSVRGGTTKNNTLNIGTSTKKVIGLSAGSIANIDNLNFYMPTTLSDGDTALTLNSGNLDLTNTTITVNNLSSYIDGTGNKYYLLKNTGAGTISVNDSLFANNTYGDVFNVIGSTQYNVAKGGIFQSADKKDLYITSSNSATETINGDTFGDDEAGIKDGITVNLANSDYANLNINIANSATINLTNAHNVGSVISSGSTLDIKGGSTFDTGASIEVKTANFGDSSDAMVMDIYDISALKAKELNFYLPSNVAKDETALKVANSVDLSGTKVNAYLKDATGITSKDDKIHLIQTKGSLTGFDEANGKANLTNVNIAGLINVTGKIAVDSTGKNLDLTFNGTPSGSGGGSGSGGATANANSKQLLENSLAGMIAVNETIDNLVSNLDNLGSNTNSNSSTNANSQSNNANSDSNSQSSINENSGEAVVFANIIGHDKRFITGSHVDSKGFSLSSGVVGNDYYNSGKLTTGLFVEYGKAKYESVLDNGLVGEGKTEFIGGGAFGKFKFINNFYTEASARIGNIKTKAEKGMYDEYKLSNTYYGAHFGLGKVFDITSSNELDIYAKYFYSHIAGEEIELRGVNVDLGSVTSSKFKAGFKDSMKFSDTSSLYAGLAYQYEAKGDAKGSLSAFNQSANIASPSLKGSTGIAELGYAYETNSIKFDIGAKGYVGKERGYSGNLGVTFKF